MTAFPDLEAELRHEFTNRADLAVFSEEPFSPEPRLGHSDVGRTTSTGHVRTALWVVSAAAVLLIAVLAVNRHEPNSTDRTTSPAADGPGISLSTISQIADDEWIVPADDAFILDLAFDSSPLDRYTAFRRGNQPDPLLHIHIESAERQKQTEQYNAPWTTETIAGREWSRSADGSQYIATVGDHNVRVDRLTGLSDRELRAVIAELRIVPESVLSLPVLRPAEQANATDVATLERAEGTYTVRALTDGRAFCLFLERGKPGATTDSGGGGCGGHLNPGEAIADPSAQGPDPQALAAGLPVETVLFGVVDRSVANVLIHLVNGDIVATQPQDLSGTMPVRFYVVAVPTKTEEGLEQLDYIEAQDATGNELGRTSLR